MRELKIQRNEIGLDFTDQFEERVREIMRVKGCNAFVALRFSLLSQLGEGLLSCTNFYLIDKERRDEAEIGKSDIAERFETELGPMSRKDFALYLLMNLLETQDIPGAAIGQLLEERKR